MQFVVRSMDEKSEDRVRNESREGIVGQVCREWLVREDEGVAHRLQDEEYQSHYGHNRTTNQIVRQDTQQAKHLQTEEEETAAEVQKQIELMCLKQEEEDAKVALEVQEQLSLQETEKQRHLEEADEQYARHLQDREKERILKRKRERGFAREHKQVEKALAHHSQKNNPNGYFCDDSESLASNDFSDLCVQPTSDMDELQSKVLQEHEDEKLARLLQEQETKRGGGSDQDKRLAVETQDREIAKYLQEQERAKVRKAKERAHLKTLQQQKEQEQTDDSHQELSVSLPKEDSPPSTTRTSGGRDDLHLSNIAIAIDPTYNRGVHDYPKVSSSAHSAPVTPAKAVFPKNSSNDRRSYQTEIRKVSLESDYRNQETSESDPAPPYMPIQGQRRSGSLEKPSAKKNKKDSCKNQ